MFTPTSTFHVPALSVGTVSVAVNSVEPPAAMLYACSISAASTVRPPVAASAPLKRKRSRTRPVTAAAPRFVTT